MARVSGLLYTPSFLTDDDEHTLLNLIDNQPWSAALKRRVQHYGYSYNYQARNTSLTQPLPDWLRQLGERVSAVVDGHPRLTKSSSMNTRPAKVSQRTSAIASCSDLWS